LEKPKTNLSSTLQFISKQSMKGFYSIKRKQRTDDRERVAPSQTRGSLEDLLKIDTLICRGEKITCVVEIIARSSVILRTAKFEDLICVICLV